jgi:hypothetical protein
MARNHLPPSDVILAVIAGLAMLLGAIIARNFWLSLALGIVGAATFAFALFRLHQYRRSLPKADGGSS